MNHHLPPLGMCLLSSNFCLINKSQVLLINFQVNNFQVNLKYINLNRARDNTKQYNLLSLAACSFKQGNKGRLKAFLLTVSNFSQLLQRSALTNYCIDPLEDKVLWIKPKKLTVLPLPHTYQKKSTGPVRLL